MLLDFAVTLHAQVEGGKEVFHCFEGNDACLLVFGASTIGVPLQHLLNVCLSFVKNKCFLFLPSSHSRKAVFVVEEAVYNEEE